MASHRQHEARHSHMDMGGMDMSVGGYSNAQLQFHYWTLVGSVIGFMTLVNILDHILLMQRLKSRSAKPTSRFWCTWATITAVGREVFNAAAPTWHIWGRQVQTPVAGPSTLVLAYIVAVVVFMYIGDDPSNSWNWEQVAVRVGVINQAQLPLLFLLAGKQNIIGWFTGIGYERLSWFHRWVGRILWVGVTMHMGFFFRSWMRWDYIKVKVAKDDMTRTGIAAWSILTALFLLSFAPVRRSNYELFVITHIVLFAGLVGCVMIHVDVGIGYVWACVALYLFDRMARFVTAIFCNLSFRWKGARTLWAHHATLTPLPGDVTRIAIAEPAVGWAPGQHMFLSCHSIAPLQSHPFTAASLPSDGRLEFLVRARSGGTRRLRRWASKYEPLSGATPVSKLVGIEGPYGYIRPLQQFDAVVLLAGGTGATFAVPLMRDLVHRWSQRSAITKSVRLVWAIKSRDRLCWFQSQLEQAIADVKLLQQSGAEVDLDISIYITCDDEFDSKEASARVTMTARNDESAVDEKMNHVSTAEIKQPNACGPDGQCCCRAVVANEEGSADQAYCCCDPSPSDLSSASFTTTPMTDQFRLKTFSGRPHIRNIIRKVLEEADGESAVVACGPVGLRHDVRRTVVGLSDERAVHKGTGAQGIYLHLEGFDY